VTGLGLLHLSILKHFDVRKNNLLLLWLIPPVLLGLLTALVLPVYSYFRLLFVLPAYLLMLSTATVKWSKVVVVSNILFLAIFWLSPKYHKEDWRTLTRSLDTHSIVAMPSRAQAAPLLYYGWDKPILEPSHESLSGEKIAYIRYVEDLFDTQKLGQANFAASGYTISSQKVYPGIQVDLYENSN
jgi:hypothetical protein